MNSVYVLVLKVGRHSKIDFRITRVFKGKKRVIKVFKDGVWPPFPLVVSKDVADNRVYHSLTTKPSTNIKVIDTRSRYKITIAIKIDKSVFA